MPSFRTNLDESARSATDKAYAVLRSEVLSCTLAPGTRIVEGEIAERLGMSKTPVKKALGMLIHEGFVEVRPRHGYRVTDVTLADVQEIYQLRQVVEPAAAELAATNATPEQLQQLRALVEEHADDTYDDRAAKVIRFHEILAEASGSTRLAAVLGNLLDETRRLLSLGLDIEQSVNLQAGEHRQLLDALLKGNHHIARQIAEQQVETGRMRMFEAILASLTSAGGAAETVVLRPHRSDSSNDR
ncbi:MAG: GntR family transcriptional regulator [Acidimicrobiia bacterium]|nr:GntR family transcriptional regulator [Acidimicrobiia bacterium]MDX2465748.1 GntR family transcriptional regulator [Acidimicrobiia bacterium]